jgi:anti-sigma factor RsiW
MTCRRIEKFLPALAEGSLGLRNRALVERHLAGCPACRRLVALLRQTERALAHFPEVEPSDRLLDRLYALPGRMAESPSPRGGFILRLVRQPVFVPAAVVLLAVCLFVTNPHRDAVLRAVNRQVHRGFNTVEKVYAQAGSWLDKLNAYKEDALVSLKRINPLSPNGDKE